MKMATITGVSDSNISTTDGIKSQIGDFNARVGDHVWVDKNCVYGHETGGGTAPTVIGGIPLLSYTLQHGVLAGNRFKYKTKGQFSGGEPWDHDSGKFINDKSSAYYLPVAPAPRGQYDLMAGETVSNLQLYQIFDACIDQTEDWPVLVLAGDTTESYGWSYNGDYHLSHAIIGDHPHDAYGLQMGPTPATSFWEQQQYVINRHSEWRIYRGGETLHDVNPRIDAMIAQAKEIALSMSEGADLDPIVNQFSVTEIKTVTKPGGTYTMTGSCVVRVYADVAYQWTTRQWTTWVGNGPPPYPPEEMDHTWVDRFTILSENQFKFLWTITESTIDLTLVWDVMGWHDKSEIMAPPIDFYESMFSGIGLDWRLSGTHTDYTIPPDYTTHTYIEQYKFPLNDGFYYIAHGDAVSDSGAASTFDVFDAEGNLIVELGESFMNYNYTNAINCIASVSGGRHLIALNDAFLTLVVVKEGVPTVIEINEDWPGLQNARLVETSKLKKIKSGFEKYFDVGGE